MSEPLNATPLTWSDINDLLVKTGMTSSDIDEPSKTKRLMLCEHLHTLREHNHKVGKHGRIREHTHALRQWIRRAVERSPRGSCR